jgi:hypothetical protein
LGYFTANASGKTRQATVGVNLEQFAHPLKMLAQRFGQRIRQHRDPILSALAVAHHDFPPLEFHVLTQHHFHHPHPVPYSNRAISAWLPSRRDNTFPTSARVNTVGRRCGFWRVLLAQPRQLDPQYFFIKEQCRQR